MRCIMGIFSRLSDIINSNVTALLDKAEDPQKMIRMIIQEMEETLIEVRSSSARIIADKKTLSRRIDALDAEVGGWEDKAALAISKGREDLARAALVEKTNMQSDLDISNHEMASLEEHLTSLEGEVAQLQAKLNEAKAKQKALVLKVQTVKQRQTIQNQTSRDALGNAFEKFEQFERRIDLMEGELESGEIGRPGKQSLSEEIADLERSEKIDSELEALKARMKKD
jgi:phage shock protein A